MRGEGIIFFSQPLPISPRSSLVASRGEGGWGEVATEFQPVLQLLTPLFPPQKEHGSPPTRAFIANLALLLPDRAKPSPTRSH